jgi:hypothetical protein
MKGVLSLLSSLVLGACCPPAPAKKPAPPPVAVKPDVKDLAAPEEVHLQNVRQLTFGADNAEAYWAFGGDKLILQTNHAPYQCDQIEVLNVKDGTSKLVSTGKGRTTCSYFLKGDQEIVYASTHEVSPSCPTPPDMSKGYLWGLFDYNIYKANADGSNLRKLTNEKGYNAEATVCGTDGSILFTSDRSGDLELWRMDADGKNLKQLTSARPARTSRSTRPCSRRSSSSRRRWISTSRTPTAPTRARSRTCRGPRSHRSSSRTGSGSSSPRTT